jgi:hypothetical protein
MPQEGHDYRHLTRPQHAILYNDDGHIIVDYIMRFESLQRDFDHVCDVIGKPRRALQHDNRGNRQHYTKYFDDETRAKFLNLFRKDVELFGYQY